MTQEADNRQRRSIRLQGYDYAQAGAYFVTIVARDRACLFGKIIGGEMHLDQFGHIVKATWDELPHHYSNVERDALVVMPNHIHGIIMLSDVDGGRESDVGAGFKPARGVPAGPNSGRAGFKPATLPEIVRAFKTFSARRINELRRTIGSSVWQRNYYEHVVRGEIELHRIREYIANNPLQWEMDRENPFRNTNVLKQKAEGWEV